VLQGGNRGGPPLTIAAHARTAIYIDGDVVSSAQLAFVLDPTAELDIFIAGTIKASQTLVIGSPIAATASIKRATKALADRGACAEPEASFASLGVRRAPKGR